MDAAPVKSLHCSFRGSWVVVVDETVIETLDLSRKEISKKTTLNTKKTAKECCLRAESESKRKISVPGTSAARRKVCVRVTATL